MGEKTVWLAVLKVFGGLRRLEGWKRARPLNGRRPALVKRGTWERMGTTKIPLVLRRN